MGIYSPRKSLIACVLARPDENVYTVIAYSIILHLSPCDSGNLPHPASFGLPIWQTENASQHLRKLAQVLIWQSQAGDAIAGMGRDALPEISDIRRDKGCPFDLLQKLGDRLIFDDGVWTQTRDIAHTSWIPSGDDLIQA